MYNANKIICAHVHHNHRKESDNKLEEIIYKADKLSRQCFNCKAEKECYWSSEKKNFKITY